MTKHNRTTLALALAALTLSPLKTALARPDGYPTRAEMEAAKAEAEAAAQWRADWMAQHAAIRRKFFLSIGGNWQEQIQGITTDLHNNIGNAHYSPAIRKEMGGFWGKGVRSLTPAGEIAVMYYGAKIKLSQCHQEQNSAYRGLKLQKEALSVIPEVARSQEAQEKLHQASQDHQNAIHAVKVARRQVLALEIILLENNWASPKGDPSDWKEPTRGNTLTLTSIHEGQDYELVEDPQYGSILNPR